MREWISVEDQIPEKGADIWIFRDTVPSGKPFVDRIPAVSEDSDVEFFRHWGISHWQLCHKPDPPGRG